MIRSETKTKEHKANSKLMICSKMLLNFLINPFKGGYFCTAARRTDAVTRTSDLLEQSKLLVAKFGTYTHAAAHCTASTAPLAVAIL